jgi:hypothetical protein
MGFVYIFRNLIPELLLYACGLFDFQTPWAFVSHRRRYSISYKKYKKPLIYVVSQYAGDVWVMGLA